MAKKQGSQRTVERATSCHADVDTHKFAWHVVDNTPVAALIFSQDLTSLRDRAFLINLSLRKAPASLGTHALRMMLMRLVVDCDALDALMCRNGLQILEPYAPPEMTTAPNEEPRAIAKRIMERLQQKRHAKATKKTKKARV